jgi:hypothetical protein
MFWLAKAYPPETDIDFMVCELPVVIIDKEAIMQKTRFFIIGKRLYFGSGITLPVFSIKYFDGINYLPLF